MKYVVKTQQIEHSHVFFFFKVIYFVQKYLFSFHIFTFSFRKRLFFFQKKKRDDFVKIIQKKLIESNHP